MNMTSVVVSTALMASFSPAVANMSLQPLMAVTRSNNFASAESTVVSFSAKAEKDNILPTTPESCDLTDLQNGAYTISCHEGDGQFKQTVSRSFRIIDESGGSSYPYDPPESYTHYHCPHGDPWGVVYFNDTHLNGENCVPVPLQSSWNFSQSDPDDWLWDISDYGM